ncbi:OmpA family protein [Pedobacter cryophilus]|uniref:OmpA family protein n=1 Tax=Pedobacter cryophilus TaxID=2571271 RepID=A0A4U1C4B4_9SPHI|nr:OmpA family protein [Pedobacter cryophilus]TKB98979.1 OmpA family protein [Pedobacter cryophilus]
MNKLKSNILLIVSVLSFVTIFYSSCKSKKLALPKEEVVAEVVPETPKLVEPEKKEIDSDGDGIVDALDNCPNEKGSADNSGCPIVVEKPFNYKNIQFEFNSSVLKTSSYAVLDEIGRQIKKNPSAVFQLNGHSSIEGTEKRNMMLSVDRAVAVKAYLVNNGVRNVNLLVKGFGETLPMVPNTTETNKALNRRVEVKPIN